MSSLKGNILLNGINTVTSILFPIITFPYAARVLSGIGIVNFQLSIINYIVLLTSLGIPLYAVKEIAKYQDNKQQRDKTAIEILFLSNILCLAGYILVIILAHYNTTTGIIILHFKSNHTLYSIRSKLVLPRNRRLQIYHN